MPKPTRKASGRRRLVAVRDREIVRTALVNTLVFLALVIAAWILAPRLEATSMWMDRFSAHNPRSILGIFFAPLLLASWAPALWPQTWEGELSARALRAVAWGALLYWTSGVLLRAPEAAAAFLVPTLAGILFTALGVLRHILHATPATPAGRGPLGVVGVVTSGVGATGIIAIVAFAEPQLLTLAWVAPFALLYLAGIPYFWLRQRSADRNALPESQRPSGMAAASSLGHPFDLDAETLVPAGGTLALYVTGFTAAFVILLVAPGVPLGGPVAWVAFVFAIPAAVRALLRRQGVAHPRGLIGPPEARIHEAVVEHLSDETLSRLDDAVDKFVRTGRGRRKLASALAALLEPAVPGADAERLLTLLRSLPRAPWARKRREHALSTLLGGHRILEDGP